MILWGFHRFEPLVDCDWVAVDTWTDCQVLLSSDGCTLDSDRRREDAAICEAIITLAKSLELMIVAEGVETDGQRSFLRHLECDVYQGELFSRPVAPGKVQLMLENLNVA